MNVIFPGTQDSHNPRRRVQPGPAAREPAGRRPRHDGQPARDQPQAAALLQGLRAHQPLPQSWTW